VLSPLITTQGQQLIEQHYLEFNNLLPRSTCQLLSQRVNKLWRQGDLLDCEQCSNSVWAYDDNLFLEVQKILRESLSKALGINLLSSFSSVRRYPQGEVLEKHLDRDAAEFVVSLCIDYDGNEIWPLYITNEKSDPVGNLISLDIGDGVLFQGNKLYHWREALENQWQIQAFFFFVDADGVHKEHEGDVINKYRKR